MDPVEVGFGERPVLQLKVSSGSVGSIHSNIKLEKVLISESVGTDSSNFRESASESSSPLSLPVDDPLVDIDCSASLLLHV